MCKVNFAVSVKENMPVIPGDVLMDNLLILGNICNILSNLWHKPVDIERINGIIRLTFASHNAIGAYDAEFILSRSQTGGTARAGHGQSQAGGCQRFFVSGKRVFRPARPHTGQIRDAAPPSDGRVASFLGSPDLRPFTCHLLPSLAAVQRGWIGGTSSEAARAKESPQAFRGADYFYGNGPGRRSDPSRTGACRARQGSLRYLGSPAQHRAGTRTAAKKTTRVATKASPPYGREVAERYEQLRSQALSQSSGGCGLGLFVHRGMAAWIKAWGNYTPAGEKSTRDNPVCRRSSMEIQTDIVMIIAGMTFSCTKGGKDDG